MIAYRLSNTNKTEVVMKNHRKHFQRGLQKKRHAITGWIGSMIQKMARRHPIIIGFTAFVGVPLCILGTVFVFTYAIMLPISLLFGWC